MSAIFIGCFTILETFSGQYVVHISYAENNNEPRQKFWIYNLLP